MVVGDLSLSFPAGKTATLVGASGSRKLTVIVIERLYDPQSGIVKHDNIDSVATAKADVFQKNEIIVGIKLVKIRKYLTT